jgi:hypothetical protein
MNLEDARAIVGAESDFNALEQAQRELDSAMQTLPDMSATKLYLRRAQACTVIAKHQQAKAHIDAARSARFSRN